MIEACSRCGGALEFEGFDRQGQRVMTCINSLTVKHQDGTTDSVACNLKGEHWLGGKWWSDINWFTRRREERSESATYARCNVHGPELTVMVKPVEEKVDGRGRVVRERK